MVGYIFKAENTVTKKTYIGKNYSVKFNKKYLGNEPGVLSDAEKYGADKFIINMLKACETVKECDFLYDAYLKELHAESDVNYYNCKSAKAETVEEKPKKPRKKKAVEE